MPFLPPKCLLLLPCFSLSFTLLPHLSLISAFKLLKNYDANGKIQTFSVRKWKWLLNRILTTTETSDKNTHIAVFVPVRLIESIGKQILSINFEMVAITDSGKNEVVMGTCKPFKLADTRSRRLLLDTASVC
jgi:hypothetical protein